MNSSLSHTPCPSLSSSEPPGIQDPRQETLEGDMGTRLVLTCQVTGVAVPAVTWLKDGSPLGVCAGERCATFSLAAVPLQEVLPQFPNF